MKIFAFIAACFMLFLAVKPGIAAMSATTEQACCGGACTSSAETEEKEMPGKDTRQNTCNPFQACCAFVSLCENRQLDLLTRPEIVSAKAFNNYQSSSIIRYSSDFWQPPRIAA